ncbi:MAG: hypothetical protein JXR46_15775 [Calditrichaceae bacterium]|nr:hypothetical protein [Calditrichaceae bacterium]MBN2710504.1 hypothetical protein [Calditrichaceae bacterium]RQV97296.1 MAG: hypothetical protein EH224_01760 [Calditrichota bacterium]
MSAKETTDKSSGLIFICPETQKPFETIKFRIIDDKGFIIDATGKNIMDARVLLEENCPFCGKKHIYKANELPCPFGV